MAKHRAEYYDRNHDTNGEWSSVIDQYEELLGDYMDRVALLEGQLHTARNICRTYYTRIDSLIEERNAHTPLDEFWRGVDYALMVVEP